MILGTPYSPRMRYWTFILHHKCAQKCKNACAHCSRLTWRFALDSAFLLWSWVSASSWRSLRLLSFVTSSSRLASLVVHQHIDGQDHDHDHDHECIVQVAWIHAYDPKVWNIWRRLSDFDQPCWGLASSMPRRV